MPVQTRFTASLALDGGFAVEEMKNYPILNGIHKSAAFDRYLSCPGVVKFCLASSLGIDKLGALLHLIHEHPGCTKRVFSIRQAPWTVLWVILNDWSILTSASGQVMPPGTIRGDRA